MLTLTVLPNSETLQKENTPASKTTSVSEARVARSSKEIARKFQDSFAALVNIYVDSVLASKDKEQESTDV